MSLTKELDRILTVSEFKFDGLPDTIINSLNKLLETHHPDTLLEAMRSLIIPYNTQEETARKYRGCSGYASEEHTAAEFRIIYLRDSIEYVQGYSNKLSKNKSQQATD